MEIPNKEYLMAWLPGVSTPWMLRPRALCEGRESNCSHHGGHKSCIGGIAAHPCKQGWGTLSYGGQANIVQRMGQPPLPSHGAWPQWGGADTRRDDAITHGRPVTRAIISIRLNVVTSRLIL